MQNVNPQAGVSLMLAILILAAITAVAFSLATIVLIEIRSAGDSSRTEPALYATLGVTEEALFQFKRFYEPDGSRTGFDVTTCSGPKAAAVCEINGVELDLPGEQPLIFDNSPRVEFVAKNSVKNIPLYESGNYDQAYETVSIEVLPNQTDASVEVEYTVTDEQGNVNTVPAVTVAPKQVYTYTIPSANQYELIISNNQNTPPQDVSVKISTVRVDGDDPDSLPDEPDGLPFVGEQVLRIVANYLGLTRTYQVRIPIP